MMKLYLTLRFSTTDGYHIDRHSQKELELCSSENCNRFKSWYASLNLTSRVPFSRLQASLQKFLDRSYSGSVAEHGQLDWFVCDACFYVFRSLVINWRLQLKKTCRSHLISSHFTKKLTPSFTLLQQEIGFELSIFTAQDMGIANAEHQHIVRISQSFFPVFDCTLEVYSLPIFCKLNQKSASCTKINISGPKRLDRKNLGLDWLSAVISNDLMSLSLFIICNFRFLGSNLLYGAFPNVTTTQVQILYVLLIPSN